MNWIAILVVFCISLLVIWLTSLLAVYVRAGRSGMGWVFLAILVAGILAGVVHEAVDLSGNIPVILGIFLVISLIVFALVLDSGIFGGLLISVGYMLMVGAIVTALYYGLDIRSTEALGKVLKARPAPTELPQDVSSPPAVPGEAEQETSEGSGSTFPDKIIGFKVDGPLKVYSFDDEPADAEPEKPAYRETSSDEAAQYLNHRARVTRRDGVEIAGTLVSAGNGRLEIKRRARGGYVVYQVNRWNIRLLEVYR